MEGAGREILEPGTVLESSLGGQGHFWGRSKAGIGPFGDRKAADMEKSGLESGKWDGKGQISPT